MKLVFDSILQRWFVLFLPAMFLCLAGARPAEAVPITIIGSGAGGGGASLNAQVTFDVSGNNLIVTLENIAAADEEGGQDTPTNTLTGVFFDIVDNPDLTPVSATIPDGSLIIQDDTCEVDSTSVSCLGVTNVAGEWGFEFLAAGFGGGTNGATYGIASPGYVTTGLSMNIGNFNNGNAGVNLDDPTSLDGINFGIVSNAGTFNPNGGLNGEPLIENTVVFVLSGLPMSFDLSTAISNVSFQYGTDLDEPNIPGNGGGPPGSIPEPEALILMGTGLIGLALIRRRRQSKLAA